MKKTKLHVHSDGVTINGRIYPWREFDALEPFEVEFLEITVLNSLCLDDLEAISDTIQALKTKVKFTGGP